MDGRGSIIWDYYDAEVVTDGRKSELKARCKRCGKLMRIACHGPVNILTRHRAAHIKRDELAAAAGQG